MRLVRMLALSVVLLFTVVTPVSAFSEQSAVTNTVVTTENVDVYEGFRSPNEVVFAFIFIVVLSIIGLGAISAIE